MEEVLDMPQAVIELFNTDKNDQECEVIFHYELPLNFKHDCDLSHNLYALGIKHGHALGFLFDLPMEKE